MTKEEAIKIVRENMHLSNDEGNIFEALKTLVPELRESEDERTRKELIDYLAHRADVTAFIDEGEDCKRWIAYLEKQKEQIVIKQNIIDSIRANTQPDWDFSAIPNLHEEINRFFGEKFILPHTEDTIITVSDVIRCAYHFYKFGQQEQKPAEWSEEEEKKISELKTFIAQCNGFNKENRKKAFDMIDALHPQHHWKPSEEKQLAEWSEEDKSILNNIIAYKYLNIDDLEWLKSLPYRFSLQPKQEWSEEDEAAFGDLMWCIEQARKSAKDENDMGNIWFADNWVKNRLKFLRPGHITYALDAPLGYDKDMNPIYPPINHWKPSKGQMNALFTASDRNDKLGAILNSLYNDLKKL